MHEKWQQFLSEIGANFIDGQLHGFSSAHIEAGFALNERTTLFELSAFHGLKVSGEDAQQFLQGQLTNDVTALSTNKAQLTACCTHKGRIVGLFYLLLVGSDYFILLPRTMCDIVATHLNKYAIFSKVSIEALPDNIRMIGIQGSEANQYIQQHFGQVPEQNYSVIHQAELSLIAIPGHLPRYLCIGPYSCCQDFWQKIANPQLAASTAWHLLDIHAGMPQIFPATSEKFTPHMINLPELEGVSFNKGCYTGQEIIARTQYLGKAKQHLIQLTNLGTELLPRASHFEHPDYQKLVVLDSAINAAGQVDGLFSGM